MHPEFEQVSQYYITGSKSGGFSRISYLFSQECGAVAMTEHLEARQASSQALETISKYFHVALVEDAFFQVAYDTLQKLGFRRWDLQAQRWIITDHLILMLV